LSYGRKTEFTLITKTAAKYNCPRKTNQYEIKISNVKNVELTLLNIIKNLKILRC